MNACRIFLIISGVSLKTLGVGVMFYGLGGVVTAIGCAMQCRREEKGA